MTLAEAVAAAGGLLDLVADVPHSEPDHGDTGGFDDYHSSCAADHSLMG
jgi:hypothetical protein